MYNTYGGERVARGRPTPADLPALGANDAQGAAVSVAIMIVGAALFLTILKRSGFRAMVAVGRS